jgi:putative methyltransferase (TIGR04325 family)
MADIGANSRGVINRVVHAVRRRVGAVQEGPHFRGAFASYAEALAAVRPGVLAGYNHAEVADISFEKMCQRTPWDYPVLFWLQRVLPNTARLIDAGGHMGTKFRAFRDVLDLPAGFDWAIYDVPEIVKAGRARAAKDDLSGISFYDQIEATPPADILLASGLLQYLDIPFPDFVARLPQKPTHLILNKVATRAGPTVVTLEDFDTAEIPYQVRDHAAFVAAITDMGYAIIDSWDIPPLSRTHPTFGRSTSRGFYARLK